MANWFPLAGDGDRDRFMAFRRPLHAGELSLLDICRREGLKLAVDRIHFRNRFVTPRGKPRRFDTRFFIAEAPAEQTGRHDERETVDSIWITPGQALARNAAGEFDLMAVTRAQLERLARFDSARALLSAAAENRYFPTYRPKLPPQTLDVAAARAARGSG